MAFIKLMQGPEVAHLIRKNKNAFILLTIIAVRASREGSKHLGLEVGEALIGDYPNYQMTYQEYRNCKRALTQLQYISSRATTKGTVAKLTSKAIFDLNLQEVCNHFANTEQANAEQSDEPQPSIAEQGDDEQPLTKNKELRIKNKEEEKIKNSIPYGIELAALEAGKEENCNEDALRSVESSSTEHLSEPIEVLLANGFSQTSSLEAMPLTAASPPPSSAAPPPQGYGNGAINGFIDALRAKVGIDCFADVGRWQRVYAKHCLTLIKQIGKEEFRRRLDLLLLDDFHRKNLNKVKYIYYNVKGFIEPKDQGLIFIS